MENKIIIYLLYFSICVVTLNADEDLSEYLLNKQAISLITGDNDSGASKSNKNNNTEDGTKKSYLKCSKYIGSLLACILINKDYSTGWKVDIGNVEIPNTPPKKFDNEQARNTIPGAIGDWIENIFKIILS
ncbi:uncharacterized protein LOC131841812 [Achroia grisella]|uniref:uncharacterized protein LOC131841812 n=1 Tax=Achroia grisella TaxID=688607 RepID=UPI0027D1F5DF|nr:uncharacterized protein LOC131841812 [Achroia grisella]